MRSKIFLSLIFSLGITSPIYAGTGTDLGGDEIGSLPKTVNPIILALSGDEIGSLPKTANPTILALNEVKQSGDEIGSLPAQADDLISLSKSTDPVLQN